MDIEIENKPESAKEISISCEEAKESYNIHCRYGQMPTNGELRFRLLSENDGTAYIRTQTADNYGWQNSHYHKGVRETYIIQESWICYAEIRGREARYVKYEAGGVFTTEPSVAHNIYMPRRAIIHTVKHGVSVPNPEKGGNDWWDNTRDVKLLQGLTRGVGNTNEEEILNLIDNIEFDYLDISIIYTESYRHFDNLIWTIPGFAMAIIAGALTSLSYFISTPTTGISLLTEITGFSPKGNLCMVLGVVALSISLISYTVHRFRWHQAGLKSPPKKHRWTSPQVMLLLFINCAAATFLWMALRILRILEPSLSVVPKFIDIALPLLLAVGVTWWQNSTVLRKFSSYSPRIESTSSYRDTRTIGFGSS